jgi:hypothetical protein
LWEYNRYLSRAQISSMNIATSFLNLLKTSATLFVTFVGFLFGADDNEVEDRPLENGSDFFGDHNFRTGSMDSGSDPDGWYEEDL